MAKETVEAIRQAELRAAQIEKEVAKEYDMILLKAEEDAKKMILSMTKEALAKAEDDLQQAQQQGVLAGQAAVLRAEKEIVRLSQIAKNKEQAAIDLVLSEVI